MSWDSGLAVTIRPTKTDPFTRSAPPQHYVCYSAVYICNKHLFASMHILTTASYLDIYTLTHMYVCYVTCLIINLSEVSHTDTNRYSIRLFLMCSKITWHFRRHSRAMLNNNKMITIQRLLLAP